MKSKVELTTRKGAWICLSDNRWINCQTISEFRIHVNGDSTAQTGSDTVLKHAIRIYNCQKYHVHHNNLEVYAFGIFLGPETPSPRTTTSTAGLRTTTSVASLRAYSVNRRSGARGNAPSNPQFDAGGSADLRMTSPRERVVLVPPRGTLAGVSAEEDDLLVTRAVGLRILGIRRDWPRTG